MFVSIEWARIVSATKTADVYRSIEAKKLANNKKTEKWKEQKQAHTVGNPNLGSYSLDDSNMLP